MKPLRGLTLLHTRPRLDDDAIASALVDAGATLLHAPMISFGPPHDPAALAAAVMGADTLLLTSPRAVASVARLVKRATPVYPLGGATLAAARAAGMAAVELPDAHDGASLGEALARRPGVAGQHFTLPTSDLAEPAVVAVLQAAGARVTVVEAYRTLPAASLPADVADALANGRVDAVLCMSPSAVDTLVALAGVEPLRALLRAAPGDTTARAWLRHGLPAHAVAGSTGPAALVSAVAACWPRA